MSLENTLKARKARYGDFTDHAAYAQRLKMVCRSAPSWNLMTTVHQEALDMIMHKIARALCGDPMYCDTVRDIVGYAQLLLERMEVMDGATDAKVTKVIRKDGQWEPQEG